MSKSRKYLLFAVFFALLFIRFINLEQDPPAYNQAAINVTDEPYYCITGLNKFNESKGKYIPDFDFHVGDFLLWHNKTITFLSLKLLGNNYIGLRSIVVILSIFSSVLIYWIMMDRFKPRLSLGIGIIFFLVFDYYFFLFSRYQTPQLYSIFWITLTIALAYLGIVKSKVFLSLSIVSLLFMVFFVYPYTAFLGLGFVLFAIWWLINVDKTIISYFLVGTTAFIPIALLVLYLNKTEVLDYFNFFLNFGKVRDETATIFEVKTFLLSPFQIINSNLFRYNPAYFIAILAPLVFFIKNSKLRQDKFFILIVFILVSAFAQAFFINSYPFKKWIMLYPVVSLCVIFVLNDTINWEIGNSIYIIAVTGIVFLLGLKSFHMNNQQIYWSGFVNSYPFVPLDKQSFYFGMACIIIVGITFILVTLKKINLLCPLYAAILLPTVFTFSFLFDPRYVHKESLLELNDLGNPRLILGDFSHAYSFYNNHLPSYNPYNLSVNFVKNIVINKAISNYAIHDFIFLRKNLTLNILPTEMDNNGIVLKALNDTDKPFVLYTQNSD